jgi:hypothetical protein
MPPSPILSLLVVSPIPRTSLAPWTEETAGPGSDQETPTVQKAHPPGKRALYGEEMRTVTSRGPGFLLPAWHWWPGTDCSSLCMPLTASCHPFNGPLRLTPSPYCFNPGSSYLILGSSIFPPNQAARSLLLKYLSPHPCPGRQWEMLHPSQGQETSTNFCACASCLPALAHRHADCPAPVEHKGQATPLPPIKTLSGLKPTKTMSPWRWSVTLG